VGPTSSVSASTTVRPSTTTTLMPPVPTGDFTGRPLGRPGCAPASPIDASEVPATSSDSEAWGLLFGVPKVGDLKIAWRMTGSGDLQVTATSPSGATVAPAWGPEAHGGSNWDRPGDEWGTGWVFDQPGCWQLHLARDVGSADVWLEVSA
jgi:hypothetical protein